MTPLNFSHFFRRRNENETQSTRPAEAANGNTTEAFADSAQNTNAVTMARKANRNWLTDELVDPAE